MKLSRLLNRYLGIACYWIPLISICVMFMVSSHDSTLGQERALSLADRFVRLRVSNEPDSTVAHTQALYSRISSSGRYIVGLQTDEVSDPLLQDVRLYLWSTETLVGNESILPVSQTSISLSPNLDLTSGLDGKFAISPDESLLAVQTSESLKIFTLPDFRLYTTVVGRDDSTTLGMTGNVVWSPDSASVATFNEFNSLMVWNRESQQVQTWGGLQIGPRIPRIVATPFGWIVNQLNQTFVYCPWDLWDCESHPYNSERESADTIIVSRDGRFIVVAPWQGNSPYEAQVWRAVDGTHYKLDPYPLTFKVPFYAGEIFSPNSQYVSFGGFDSYVEIWRFEPRTYLQRIPVAQYSLPVWLSGERYFLTLQDLGTITLYELENDTPVDQVIAPIANTTNSGVTQSQSLTVSNNGLFALLNVMNESFILPIHNTID